MKYLLDTNIVSEAMKITTNPAVNRWMASVAEHDLAISVVGTMEVRRGIEMMPVGRRRQDLDDWLTNDVPVRFSGRILGIDAATADICGTMLGQRHLGAGIRRIMDFWLAAQATQHGLTVVTRNVKDFQGLGVSLFNPWQEDPA